MTSAAARRDLSRVAGSAAAFSFSLGGAGVALPLLAVAAGYSEELIGVLTAVSAVAQMAVRSMLGVALSHLSERALVVVAALMLALSSGVAAVSAAIVPFVVAELLQGAARGCFWTGSQSQVVRGTGSAVRSLAAVNLVSSLGLLTGPVVAGAVAETDVRASLVVATVAALGSAAIAASLARHPPYRPPPRALRSPLWRRSGVAAACWAGVTAGAWRGLLASFVPVVLAQAGQPAGLVGALVAVANGASIVGAGGAGRLPARLAPLVLALGTAATGAGTAVVALAGGQPILAAGALAVSGLGGGAVQTLGPALAVEAVPAEERGLAIATTGTFRAVALLFAPLAVSGLVLTVPVTVGLAVAGLLISAPAALVHAKSRRAVT